MYDDEEAERAYLEARTQRAHQYAEEVLPLLTAAGFTLRRPDGTAAGVDDVADAMTGPRLSVSDG